MMPSPPTSASTNLFLGPLLALAALIGAPGCGDDCNDRLGNPDLRFRHGDRCPFELGDDGVIVLTPTAITMTPAPPAEALDSDGPDALPPDGSQVEVVVRGWVDPGRAIAAHGYNVDVELAHCGPAVAGQQPVDAYVTMTEVADAGGCTVDGTLARCLLNADGIAKLQLTAGSSPTQANAPLCLFADSGERPTSDADSGERQPSDADASVLVTDGLAGVAFTVRSPAHAGSTCGASRETACVVEAASLGAALCSAEGVDCDARVRKSWLQVGLVRNGIPTSINYDLYTRIDVVALSGEGGIDVNRACDEFVAGPSGASILRAGSTIGEAFPICFDGRAGMYEVTASPAFVGGHDPPVPLFLDVREQPSRIDVFPGIEANAVGESTFRVHVQGCPGGIEGATLDVSASVEVLDDECGVNGTNPSGDCSVTLLGTVDDNALLVEVGLVETDSQCLVPVPGGA